MAAEDVEAIVAAPPRLAVYRSLVRNGLASVVAADDAADAGAPECRVAGRFDADLAAFLDEVGAAHALPARRAGRVPRVGRAALARGHAACRRTCGPRGPRAGPVRGGRRGAVARARARRRRWRWIVPSPSPSRCAWSPTPGPCTSCPADEDGDGAPARRDVQLLAYRDAEHVVRWLELTPLAAAVLERLVAGEPLGAAVEHACQAHRVAPAAVLPDVARLLADLGERGVLLGAGPSTARPKFCRGLCERAVLGDRSADGGHLREQSVERRDVLVALEQDGHRARCAAGRGRAGRAPDRARRRRACRRSSRPAREARARPPARDRSRRTTGAPRRGSARRARAAPRRIHASTSKPKFCAFTYALFTSSISPQSAASQTRDRNSASPISARPGCQ